MPTITHVAEARQIAERAPAALRELTREMLEEMDAHDPGRLRLAPTLDDEVDRVVRHAGPLSWRHAVERAAGDVLGLDRDSAANHPAVALAESRVAPRD